MEREILRILHRMDMEHIDTQLALQCAPLLCGKKEANLLTTSKQNAAMLRDMLDGSEISCSCLQMRREKITFLLFRRKRWERFLRQERVLELFPEQAYPNRRPKQLLRAVQMRYQSYMDSGGAFPHEIGLLLGYPPEDVRGFIENKGKNFLYSGYWKVYEDAERKKELFRQFDLAKEWLIRKAADGTDIGRLIHNGQKNLSVD